MTKNNVNGCCNFFKEIKAWKLAIHHAQGTNNNSSPVSFVDGNTVAWPPKNCIDADVVRQQT